ncbi:MAG TPA: dynamin family protein [Bryobacteraceae bacterium]|nr:dynamin family protein [Bryobacteraceae bacterium]
MILETEQDYPKVTATGPVELVTALAERYGISALSGLLATTRAAIERREIPVAVLGRFKAGKSSFLNVLIARDILPAGVIPVTSVVTEIGYGARESATVHFLDAPPREAPLDQIGAFISEKENPENVKRVDRITIELPAMRRFRGLKFVDTPGLESAHSHNSRTSLAWLPNVGLALVAVSVDPPLSQRDIELLQSLYQHTPRVAVLLTKADLVSEGDLAEVLEFVRSQLARNFAEAPPVFPFSARPGFERFRETLEAVLFDGTIAHFAEERRSIVDRKIDTLLRECGDYLALSLKSAEMQEAERQALGRQVMGEREAIDDAKSQIRLAVREAAAGARWLISARLEAHQCEIERRLLRKFEGEFPAWKGSLAKMLSWFEEWLAAGLRGELMEASSRERHQFFAPLEKAQRQAFRALQQFRDRLSERTLKVFGVPLRTTETEIRVVEPRTPNIRVGKVFDRNWELLSPVLPVWLIKPMVHRHFARTIPYRVFQNLSRAGAQWEESLQAALASVEEESHRRLDELIATVERLLEGGATERVPELREDLAGIQAARRAAYDIQMAQREGAED